MQPSGRVLNPRVLSQTPTPSRALLGERGEEPWPFWERGAAARTFQAHAQRLTEAGKRKRAAGRMANWSTPPSLNILCQHADDWLSSERRLSHGKSEPRQSWGSHATVISLARMKGSRRPVGCETLRHSVAGLKQPLGSPRGCPPGAPLGPGVSAQSGPLPLLPAGVCGP